MSDAEALPLVSIVVPVFNGERYIRESLDSILSQSYRNIEVLVMDDGSTDQTAKIIEQYQGRVKLYRQARNRGQFNNVNDGINMAYGEFIAVYHADDVYAPNIVESEVDFLRRRPEAGAVFGLEIFIDANGRDCGRVQLPPELKGGGPFDYKTILNALLTYKNRFLCGPTSMVRAAVYKEVGLYSEERFGIASDLEMWMRIVEKHPIGILDQHLLRYRFGHGNSSQNYYRRRTELERHFLIMDLYLDRGGKRLASPEALSANKAHRAEDYLMVAINYYILGRVRDCRNTLTSVRPADILASGQVQSCRLLILFFMIKILSRLPRIGFVAHVFQRRWHLNKYGRLQPILESK